MIQSKTLRRFGVVLPLALLVAVAVISIFGLGEAFVFNPQGLILILHTIFLTGIGIIIAIVSARSYLRQGNLSILLLGTAVLILAVSGQLGGILLSNYGTIINNIGICASSAVQVISAIVALVVVKSILPAKRKIILEATYLGVVAFITALTAVTFSGIMPVFLTPQGPTLIRTTVLGVTVFLFASSCVVFFWRYQQSKAKTLYWYSLALALFAIAFLSFMLQTQLADTFGWIGRLAEYSGSIFFIVALLQPSIKVEDRADLSERWAEAFKNNREQVDDFFSRMLDSFAYFKILINKGGKPIDYVFLDINNAFEKLIGLTKNDILGKKASEIMNSDVLEDWLSILGPVALTGEPVTLDHFSKFSKKWEHITVYSPQKNYLVSISEDITERKKAEDALRLSEERFSKAFNLSPFAVIMTRLSDGTYVDVNGTFLKMFEFSREEVIGHTANEIKIYAKPDGRSAYLDAFKNGRVSDFEVDLKTKTGKPLKALGYAEIINVNGQDLTFGTLVDITERKKAEEALNNLNDELEERVLKRTDEVSAERQRLYNVLETLPAYVILLDKDYCVPFANKVFRERFGESHGRRCYDFLFKRESPCENCETYKVLKTNGPHHWEWTGPDGRDYDIYDFPFVEADGSTLVLEMGIDITERKRVEKQIRDVSLYSRSLIEASLDPLVTISAEGKITDVNQATELATGCSKEELVGSDFSDYFTEPERARIGYKQVFSEGFVRDYPLAIKHKSGKITDVLYNATIYTNEAGEMQGVFAAARDVTELKKVEEQAQEAAKKLKDAERLAAIGATAGMVGHDIRNPLQAITGDLFLAKSELSELPENENKTNAIESLDEIQNNIDYINKIVADLQDYARPLNPRAQETNIKSLFNDILAKNVIPKNIKVSVKVEDKAEKVMADPDYLKRIAANLTLNAVQAMPDGGKLTIHAFVDKATNDVLITVKDTGVGIPEDIKPKLFTPMMTTKSKGQGFGLAVVKRMTEGLGGTVTFESKEGKGTTFIVRFPPIGAKR